MRLPVGTALFLGLVSSCFASQRLDQKPLAATDSSSAPSAAMRGPNTDAPSGLGLVEGIDPHQRSRQEGKEPRWRLNFTSSAPHLFASAYTLLQQWSNTVFPNGHTLAACEIPAYTLMYHGRMTNDTPPSPEWLAFDIEMAYGIMGSTRNSFMLTYQTVRPIKCLYFDGESATLMGLGQLDTQMLQLYGNVTGPPRTNGTFSGLWPEYARANGLCDWLKEVGLRGRGWGVEGIVRMNAGFELIWCDFMSESLRLLTRMNVTAPQLPPRKGTVWNEASGWREDGHKWRWAREDNSEEAGDDDDGLDDNDDEMILNGDRGDDGERSSTSYYPLPPAPTRTDKSSSPTFAPVPPNWRTYMSALEREPFLRSQGWGWFLSATYHYGSNRAGPGQGETRARILNCGIASYYAPLFANQTRNRAMDERKRLNLTDEGAWKGSANTTWGLMQLARRRRFHHLEAASREEAALMRGMSEAALVMVLRGDGNCSGADWVGMMGEIVQRIGWFLKAMEEHLAGFDKIPKKHKDGVKSWMAALRETSHIFLVSYLEYPAKMDKDTWTTPSKLFNATYARCRYHYTRLLAEQDLPRTEADMRWAIEETFGTICDVLLRTGFEVEGVWAAEFSSPPSEKKADRLSTDPAVVTEKNSRREAAREHRVSFERSLQVHAARWNDAISELLAWLGWEGEFVACEEVCAWNERCFIPMWPLLGSIWGRRPPPRNGTRPYPYPGYGRGRPSPGYGYGNGTSPPRWSLPPARSPFWMGDDSQLWKPRCVGIEHVMGQG